MIELQEEVGKKKKDETVFLTSNTQNNMEVSPTHTHCKFQKEILYGLHSAFSLFFPQCSSSLLLHLVLISLSPVPLYYCSHLVKSRSEVLSTLEFLQVAFGVEHLQNKGTSKSLLGYKIPPKECHFPSFHILSSCSNSQDSQGVVLGNGLMCFLTRYKAHN